MTNRGDHTPTSGVPDGWARKRYVTAQQAAAYLTVHTRTVYRYAADGILTPHYIQGSRAVRFLRKEVEALLVPGSPDGTGPVNEEEEE